MTDFLLRLGVTLPIIQAPMAGVQSHPLALAVSRAGGLGFVPAAMLAAPALEAALQALEATGLPYGVNFFAHRQPAPDTTAMRAWLAHLQPHLARWGVDPAAVPQQATRQPFGPEQATLLARFRPTVVSFHFGLPDAALLDAVRRTGAQIWSSATTVAEARWLAARGVDAIIAQGWEAGGHRGHFLSEDLSLQPGTFALLPQVVAAFDGPVIAAGGIATAAAVQAALRLGAQAVQVGTAFLLAQEADTSALHRAALGSEAAQHTAVTNVFSGRPARGIVNSAMRELGRSPDQGDYLSPLAPPFPYAGNAMGALKAAAEARGSADFSSLWAGQAAPLCQPGTAAEIVARLAAGMT